MQVPILPKVHGKFHEYKVGLLLQNNTKHHNNPGFCSACGPALPIGCALVVVTISLCMYVCGYFWFSYWEGGVTEPSQKLTRMIFRPF